MIQAFVFDMAGTTIDEQNIVYKTLWQAMIAEGVEVTFEEVLRLGAGKEKLQAIKDILAVYASETASSDWAKEIHLDFLDDLALAYKRLDVKTFPGVHETFEAMKASGIRVVLNTGYDRETAVSLLRKLPEDTQALIDLLVTASDVENGRPAPDMILLAMQSLDIENPAQVGKIGDSVIDIEEGKSAACGMTVGVTTGAHTREQLLTAQPDYIIDSMAVLMDLVQAKA